MESNEITGPRTEAQWRAFMDQLRRDLKDCLDRETALLEFCNVEMNWEFFRAEFEIGDNPSQSKRNALKIREYLKARGWEAKPEQLIEQAEKERQRSIALADSLGEFLTDNDGFIYWYPAPYKGHLAPYQLRWLADELDRRNEPWQKQIDKDLGHE